MVRAGQPLKVSVSLADSTGAPPAICDGCAVTFQAFAVNGSGQNAGPFAMRFHNGSGEYRASWEPAASPTGTTRIVVTVSYPGTTAVTSASAQIGLT